MHQTARTTPWHHWSTIEVCRKRSCAECIGGIFHWDVILAQQVAWAIGARDGLQFCRPQKSWAAWCPLSFPLLLPLTNAARDHPFLLRHWAQPNNLSLTYPCRRPTCKNMPAAQQKLSGDRDLMTRPVSDRPWSYTFGLASNIVVPAALQKGGRIMQVKYIIRLMSQSIYCY